MPPVTRTHTKSLPRKTGNTSPTPDTPLTSLSSAPVVSRRHRSKKTATHQPKPPPLGSKPSPNDNNTHSPPRFLINLSLPAHQRYAEVCAALRDEMRGLQPLFDEVLGGLLPWWLPVPNVVVNWVAWAVLWRVCDGVEDAELDKEALANHHLLYGGLQGISTSTGVPKYLLIAFNVILDLLMGCSSGGAAVQTPFNSNSPPSLSPTSNLAATKMVHFRTLDWGMPSLRRVLVIFDFVLESGGEVLPSTITYASSAGILTGVQKECSMSLNFRAARRKPSRSIWIEDLRYYAHLVLVLFGVRRSIGSILRGCLLPREGSARYYAGASGLSSCAEIVEEFSCRGKPLLSTPCYLCFSSGRETTVVEKDLMTAKLRSSTEFIVVTNADVDGDDDVTGAGLGNKAIATPSGHKSKATKKAPPPPAKVLEELIEDANERKVCAEKNYRDLLCHWAKELRQSSGSGGGLEDPAASSTPLPTVDDIVALVQRYPTTNECTHFAAVLDPVEGEIAWCRYWLEPIDGF